jgi:hypothetical protein
MVNTSLTLHGSHDGMSGGSFFPAVASAAKTASSSNIFFIVSLLQISTSVKPLAGLPADS